MPRNSLWYAVWKAYLKRSMEVFYHRMEVSGLENIPRNKPVIFASNHTNALMDPLVITYFSPFQDYFMTRGDVFNIRVIGALFRSWRMLPVFRMKDGMESLSQNNPVMEFVIQRLMEGHSIIIFAEGSHFWERNVHPLKKGLVRMAFEVLERQPDTELVVVPVGLHYNDLIKMNQDILVSFGAPVSVREFPREENIQKTYQSFNRLLREKMQQLVICIDKTDFYDKKNQWREELEKRLKPLPLEKSFRIQQRFIAALEDVERKNPEVLKNAGGLEELMELENFNGLHAEMEGLEQKSPGGSRMLYWLKMPLYLLSVVHFLPVLWLGRLALSKMADRTFHNSVKFGLGLLIQPLIAFFIAAVLSVVFGSCWYGFVYLLLLPVWSTFFVEFQGTKKYVV
jgi:1-acyl-sn-glycerol-3-phosphate acyltransferase